MPDFKAKMHKIRLPLRLRPRPTGGAYSAPPGPLAVFKGKWGLLLRRRGKRERREREKEGKEGKLGRVGRKREGQGPQIFWPRTAPADC